VEEVEVGAKEAMAEEDLVEIDVANSQNNLVMSPESIMTKMQV